MQLSQLFKWIVIIDPLDTLFFRDGRPFSLGEETWSNSMFPPNPTTIHGSIFSALFSKDKWNNADKNNLKIVGPFICERDAFIKSKDKEKRIKHIFVPAPADVFVEEKNKDGNIELAEIKDIRNSPFIISQINGKDENEIYLFPWLYSEKVVVPATGKYISLYDLSQYLRNEGKPKVIKSIRDFYVVEPKIGIGIDSKKRTVEERRLYNVQMIRLKDEYSLMVFMNVSDGEVNQKLENRKGQPFILKLGGEGKVAEAFIYDNNLEFECNLQNNSDYLKLYVLTPYKSDSNPAWAIKNSIGKITGATVTGFMQIGGWDMLNGKPKPMCRYIKPGSVFYVKTEKSVNSLCEDIAWKPKSAEGYGVLLPGIIEKLLKSHSHVQRRNVDDGDR